MLNKTKQLSFWSVVAGVIYCSWPLGYIVNPVVAHHGLASELAGQGQPFNWVFIYGDVVCGAIMLALTFWIIYQKRPKSFGHWFSPLGMIIFCISAAIAALCQVSCISALNVCPALTSDVVTLLHAITSISAALGLGAAVLGLWLANMHNKFLAFQFIFYFLLGLWTLIALFLPGRGVLVQNIFITACSICIAIYPWCYFQLRKNV